jgi:hypothetical protein
MKAILIIGMVVGMVSIIMALQLRVVKKHHPNAKLLWDAFEMLASTPKNSEDSQL